MGFLFSLIDSLLVLNLVCKYTHFASQIQFWFDSTHHR